MGMVSKGAFFLRKNATNRAKLKMLHHIGSKPIRDYLSKGRERWQSTRLATIFFETSLNFEEMVQADPSLPIIEIVEKCCGPQTRSHVFGLGGGVKAKDLKGGTYSKAKLLSALRSTREDIKFLNEENKSLNEENKSLNDRLSTIEDKMKEIMKMKELFVAQQSHVPPTTLSVPIE
ncbi:hypothetical protein H5410_001770 [Solanum commersonii]|uniref:Uncharacterized protein n=1 Tax=Solanum commersonii TaxID=4109 RepID=A0A9J6AZQ2_SOLCO|nr:hypothetical protein H5410_001770 [Solanum commersonii]